MPTIRYLVRNVDEAFPFYEKLGFRIVQQMGKAIAMVEREGLTLWLAGPESSAGRALPDGRTPIPGGWNRLVIEVDDLESAMAPLRDAGAHFRSDPISGPGGRQVLVDDPSGNPIELFEARKG